MDRTGLNPCAGNYLDPLFGLELDEAFGTLDGHTIRNVGRETHHLRHQVLGQACLPIRWDDGVEIAHAHLIDVLEFQGGFDGGEPRQKIVSEGLECLRFLSRERFGVRAIGLVGPAAIVFQYFISNLAHMWSCIFPIGLRGERNGYSSWHARSSKGMAAARFVASPARTS